VLGDAGTPAYVLNVLAFCLGLGYEIAGVGRQPERLAYQLESLVACSV
jgi:hypothetical protein